MSDTLSQQLLMELLNNVAALSGQVGNLQGQANIIIAEQERAAEGRAQLYERLRKVEESAAIVARIAPLVEDHEKKHQRGIGAMWLGKTLWAAGAGGAGAALASLLHYLTGRHP